MNRYKISELIAMYEQKYGIKLLHQTINKKRAISGLGVRDGWSWLLTKEEFNQVLRTPLYGCKECKIEYGEI